MAVACLAAPAVSSAAPQLRVSGNHLVDARSGQTFVPRGVNWPSFEYACSDGYGYSNSASSTNVGPNAAGAALIASWHINTVRLPLNQDCWLGEDGLPKFGKASGYRAAVRRWVSALHKADLAVVLDLHWSGPAGVVADGQRAMPDDRSDDFWSSVARTFKKDRSVIFDVFNEPYSRYDTNGTLVFDLTWDCWRAGGCAAPRTGDRQALDGGTFTTIGMWSLVDAIRATGAKQPIMLGGIDYASDLRAWLANRPERQAGGGELPQLRRPPLPQHGLLGRGDPADRRGGAGRDRRVRRDRLPDQPRELHGLGGSPRGRATSCGRGGCCRTAPARRSPVLADVKGTARGPNGTALKAHLAELAPRVSLGGGKTQALDKAVELSVRCTKACFAQVTGRLVAASRAFRLKSASRALAAGRKRTIALKGAEEGPAGGGERALSHHRSVIRADHDPGRGGLQEDALSEAAKPLSATAGANLIRAPVSGRCRRSTAKSARPSGTPAGRSAGSARARALDRTAGSW